MNNQFFEEARRSEVLSKELISNLLESMNYNNISFINWAIDLLKIVRTRIERGDKITDAVSGVVYDKKSFEAFVKEHFSSYIHSQVFADPKKAEKVYFSLAECEEGYNLVMATSSKEKTYKWISSLSERFSLVEMIATGIVYMKDNKTNTYSPFISGAGKYCRYDAAAGKIIEL